MPKGVHNGPRGRKYESLEDRFKSRYQIDEQTGCWNWTGATNSGGYGMLRPSGKPMRIAQHVSWEIKNGPIPKGTRLESSCGNHGCVNPDHWSPQVKVYALRSKEGKTTESVEQSQLVAVGSAEDCLTRKCRRCKKLKPSTDFGTKPNGDGNVFCYDCIAYVSSKGWNSYSPERREHVLVMKKQRAHELRKEVFEHYGTSCACCGEGSHERFLAIDHIEGGGNKHRRINGLSSGGSFYAWLKRNNFPPGFQTLCYNCNSAKHFMGHCPHQDEDLTARIGACG